MLRILIVGVVLTTVCVPGRCAVTQNTDKCIEATFEHHLSRLKDQIASLDQIHRQEILQLSEKRDIDVSHLNPDMKKYIDNAIEAVVNGSEAFKTQVEMLLKDSNDKMKKEMEEMNTKCMSSQKPDIDVSHLNQDLKKYIDNAIEAVVNGSEAFKTQVEMQLKDSNDKMKKEMEEMNTKYLSSQKPVGFTAFGRSFGTKSAGTILKFPYVKSSFGISHLATFQSNGKFTCEKSGIYLISIHVMRCSVGDSRFNIYKGNTQVSQYYIGRSSTSSANCNTGTGTILLHLNVRETVYVKIVDSNMKVYDLWSSFTVLKVK